MMSTAAADGPRPRRRRRRHLTVAPAPAPDAGRRFDVDRYRAGVFLDTAASMVMTYGVRTCCPRAADEVGQWCGRCVYCHVWAARVGFVAAQPHVRTVSLRNAFAIAIGVAVEYDLDTKVPDQKTTAELLRSAARDLYAQSLPPEIQIVRPT